MATYYAKQVISINAATGLGKTIQMPTTRTFRNEDDAVEQLLTWQRELERKGYRIDRQVGNTITMSKKDREGNYHAKLEVTHS